MVKILLTSDIHLGADAEKSPVPEKLRLKTFKKIAFLARSHDLLLVAGDFFNRSGTDNETLEIIISEFNSLRENGVGIIITPGENDLNENTIAYLQKLNASRIFFDVDSIVPFEFSNGSQDIFIYGIPAISKYNISEIRKGLRSGFHIGLFHADFFPSESGQSGIQIINKDDISALKLDFYALGHKHQFKLFKLNGKYIGAYPGSPEAITLDETGDRYCLSISIKDDDIFQIKRLTVNSARIESIPIDCSNFEDLTSILRTLNDKISSDTIIKLIFTGRRNFKLDVDEINDWGKECLNVIIEDLSVPGIARFTEEFSGEKSLRGEFFSILDEKLTTNGIPADIDLNILSELMDKIINSGLYTLEDLCNYWNA